MLCEIIRIPVTFAAKNANNDGETAYNNGETPYWISSPESKMSFDQCIGSTFSTMINRTEFVGLQKIRTRKR